jgi:SOS-response transcriptional repressor LexA
MTDSEYIELFFSKTYEKTQDKRIRDDRDYTIPYEQLANYVTKVISISYNEFIEYIRNNQSSTNIESSDITQSSSFSACEIEMCNALLWADNRGLNFLEVGKLFPQYVSHPNDTAYRKYGENQIRTSSHLGLVYEYYKYWYLSCIGYIYPSLKEDDRRKLLARTILRMPLYQDLVLRLIRGNVFLADYMRTMAPSTQGRRAGSVMRLLDICLNECRAEGIKYHNLYYPVYVAKTKTIRISQSQGTALKILDAYQEGCLPLYSLRAACGCFENGGISEAEGWLDVTGQGFSPDPERYFVIHAKGKSMLPSIKDGDLCVFEWCKGEPENGDVTLTQCLDVDEDYGERYTIKRYYCEKVACEDGSQKSRIRLSPINPDYDMIVLQPEKAYRTIGIFKCVL